MHSYRMAHPGQASASGSVKSGYAPVELHEDGEDIAAASAGRSSSPVSNVSLSGDEVTLPSRRSTRRSRSHAPGAASSDGEDHVRFDEHVSYIHRTDRFASPTDAADFA